MKNFRQLHVWEKAHQFVLEVYRVSRVFPKEERYGLTSQLRRSAMSIPTNIAEGCGRQGDAELSRFCQIAMGSASEVEYQLQLATDLNILSKDEYAKMNDQLVELKRMLNSFIQKLNANR